MEVNRLNAGCSRPSRASSLLQGILAEFQRLVITTSRYSLGTTIDLSPARFRRLNIGQSFPGFAALGGQCREGFVDRTVPAAESVDEMLGRTIAEIEGAAGDLKQEFALVEVLVQPGFGAPARRRLCAGWWWHVLAKGLEIWPTKPSGVQLARPIRPPGRQTRASSDAALA